MKAQVLLPKVFNFPFTYKSSSDCKIGDLVEVPFGLKKEIGVIWKNKYSEPQNIKLKLIKRKTKFSIDKKFEMKKSKAKFDHTKSLLFLLKTLINI